MIEYRLASDRGHAHHGWLDTYHSFSFADYYDPAHLGFRNLRVINEDFIAPAQGFGTHPHLDMEIITYILEGNLQHQDSMGNSSNIRPGEVQRMSAGTGVTHSEFNSSPSDAVRLLQIWILPGTLGLKPSYEQKSFAAAAKQDQLCLVASPTGAGNSVTLHTDVSLYVGVLAKGTAIKHAIPQGRHAWLQVARGQARLNGQDLTAGDGAAISHEPGICLEGVNAAEVLVFDLG